MSRMHSFGPRWLVLIGCPVVIGGAIGTGCASGVHSDGESMAYGSSEDSGSAEAACSSPHCGCDAAPECDADVTSDVDNCGSCGNVCKSGDTCVSGVCTPACSTPITSCGSPSLGAASAYGVLQLSNGTVTITLGGVGGDVAIGPNGKFAISGSSFVTGTVYLAAGDGYTQSGSSSVGGVVKNANVGPAIADALFMATTDSGLPCTQTFNAWSGSFTVTGSTGTNVLCVDDIGTSAGNHIVLTGPAGASFVVRVNGSFTMTGGSSIRVGGGVVPQDVVYDVVGSGGAIVLNGGSAVDGSILAPNRSVSLSIGTTNGQIIAGGNVTIQSGAKLLCPPATPSCHPT